jgi:hypothetical protein
VDFQANLRNTFSIAIHNRPSDQQHPHQYGKLHEHAVTFWLESWITVHDASSVVNHNVGDNQQQYSNQRPKTTVVIVVERQPRWHC